MGQTIDWRSAGPDDIPALVDFVEMAGEGLPEITWAGMAGPDESPRDVGLRRAARSEGSFSWRNATIFGRGGRIEGGMVGYPLPDEPVEIGQDFPAEFVPLQQLENLAAGTWYANILGVYPAARGQGIGAAMLERAEAFARETGASGNSVIVFAGNEGAGRLYRRAGYREVARRPVRIAGWRHDGDNAVLLVKG